MKKSLFVIGLILLVSLYVMASGVKSPKVKIKTDSGFSMKNVVINHDGAGDLLSFTVVNNSGKSISKGTVGFHVEAKDMIFGGGKSYSLNLASGEQRDFKIRLKHPLGNSAIALSFSTLALGYCDERRNNADNEWCKNKGGLCEFSCTENQSYSYKCCNTCGSGGDDFCIEE